METDNTSGITAAEDAAAAAAAAPASASPFTAPAAAIVVFVDDDAAAASVVTAAAVGEAEAELAAAFFPVSPLLALAAVTCLGFGFPFRFFPPIS